MGRTLASTLGAREPWPQVKAEFTKALALRSQIRRAGVVQLAPTDADGTLGTMIKDTRFAIAVRDDEGLWLVMSLRRDRKGNVHAFGSTGARAEKGYNSHVSHHASGWMHFKTFDKPLLPPEKRQKPDASFSGTEQVVTTPICLQTLRGTRAFKRPCRVEKYPGGVFEIAASEISPTPPGRTAVAIDLVSPGAPPLIYPLTAALRRHIFTDAIPHISVTLWDQEMMFAGADKTTASVL